MRPLCLGSGPDTQRVLGSAREGQRQKGMWALAEGGRPAKHEDRGCTKVLQGSGSGRGNGQNHKFWRDIRGKGSAVFGPFRVVLHLCLPSVHRAVSNKMHVSSF